MFSNETLQVQKFFNHQVECGRPSHFAKFKSLFRFFANHTTSLVLLKMMIFPPKSASNRLSLEIVRDPGKTLNKEIKQPKKSKWYRITEPFRQSTAKLRFWKPRLKPRGLRLHAFQLSLTHPTTKAPMTFRAPVPEDMRQLIRWSWASSGKELELVGKNPAWWFQIDHILYSSLLHVPNYDKH